MHSWEAKSVLDSVLPKFVVRQVLETIGPRRQLNHVCVCLFLAGFHCFGSMRHQLISCSTLRIAQPCQGHYTEGAELIDSVLDVVRKEAEGCDCILHWFLLNLNS